MSADPFAAAAPDDPIQRLRTVLDAELTRIFRALQAKEPNLDPVAFASSLVDFGVELAVTSGLVPSPIMADYLRALAEAIDTDAAVWPTLCVSPQPSSADSPF